MGYVFSLFLDDVTGTGGLDDVTGTGGLHEIPISII
jgi:hypothetical protein